MKTLYFEGAGCFNVNEYLDPEFRGNPRIRTAFRNDKGAAIYLELICGANYYFKNLFVDACYYIKGDDDCNKHRLGIDRHGAATMYTTNGILCLLNKIGATFDAIEVLPPLSGYKVFSDRPTNNRMASDRPVAGYNFGDEFVPDWDEIHKREMVYELLCESEYRARPQRPSCVCLWVDEENPAKLRYHLPRTGQHGEFLTDDYLANKIKIN